MSGSPTKEGDEQLKIDYDLVREILLFVEDKSDGIMKFYVKTFVDIHGRDRAKEIIYTMNYLFDIGYVTGVSQQKINPIIKDITPKGREFIEATKDNTVWHKTKEKFGDELSSKGISLIVETALSIGKSILGNLF